MGGGGRALGDSELPDLMNQEMSRTAESENVVMRVSDVPTDLCTEVLSLPGSPWIRGSAPSAVGPVWRSSGTLW